MKQLKFIIILSVAIFLFNQCSQKTGPGVTKSADGLDIHYTVYGLDVRPDILEEPGKTTC